MRYRGVLARSTAWVIIGILIFIVVPSPSGAQVRSVNDYGALGLGRLLRRLNTTASVMMIGAHPDDEDSALMAYLARGENARTAYLSLTRGDGGQNIIGPELFESLGVIRTEELLQARRLDGAEQYFGRAFDYGFSKTLTEAKQKWDEKILLCDAVRAIRLFRPMVVMSRFSGTPADGHGQHQFAGYLSPLAVKAAADPGQCVESGAPWQVLKFYAGFGGQPTLRVNTGQFDPLLGRSYFEIAMEGRSQHKSQGEGRIEYHGEQMSGLNLSESRLPRADKELSPFDGIDVSISGLSKVFVDPGAIKEELSEAEAAAKEALSKYNPNGASAILPSLVKGLRSTAAARSGAEIADAPSSSGSAGGRYADLAAELRRKEAEFASAIRYAASIQIDALADQETVVPGEDIAVAAKVFLPQSDSIKIKEISLKVPVGWKVSNSEEPKDSGPSINRREAAEQAGYFNVIVPTDELPTQPYWIEDPREGDLFRWPNNEYQNLPFQPPVLSAEVRIEVDGLEITLTQPVQFRFSDAARGEIRRDVNVVPRVSVSVEPQLLVVPLSDKPQTRKLIVSVTNNSSAPTAGTAALNINSAAEWKYSSRTHTFQLKTKGEKTSIPFEVTIPAKTKPGSYNIYPNAMVGESLVSQTMHLVAYPHIQTHRYYTRAETTVRVLDLKVAPVRIGYIMGSGDEIPEALRQMGLPVEFLDEADLGSGDLTRFDSIIIGIRATETRDDVVANNGRLLDFVRAGGTLITQYQRGSFAQKGMAPYPINTTNTQRTAAGSIARVVDENAPVKVLEPAHPVFNFPNKISEDDFLGWVQERNAYNLVTFDPQYLPLLESHDTGEAENNGGLVVAKLGKGNYIYCSYSFFRQLPAGVPGAFRLFANLVSLPKAGK
ncbi:MAG: PIG-L family deacetylase [Pyrinomonadaceae bacterium]